MDRLPNGLITVLATMATLAGLGAAVPALAGASDGTVIGFTVAGLAFGLLYGLQIAILEAHDLASGIGWLTLVVDLTWSLLNTIVGAVLGNIIYPFFATPSHAQSKHQHWIEYVPRSGSGFGHSVLQTIGTVNIGGAGQHERMHLLQARIFGPLYIPIVIASYIITGAIQILFFLLVGWWLSLAGGRQKAYMRPPATSAVGGFFGWIYYATPFELWAYATGNP